MSIHASAVIAKGAQIDAQARIGPFCVVGEHVHIGADTELVAHVVIDGHTHLGSGNVVHPFARLGGPPQDLKYRGEPAQLRLGNNNVVREGVTINVGTEAGGMCTRIGNDCLLMAYSHIAHDCTLGDNIVIANGVGLAGHVYVDDGVTIGGLAGVHQHCRIGRLAFVGGGAMVTQDVLPFCIAQGDRATLAGPNLVGLRRQGWSRERLLQLRQALQQLFFAGASRQDNIAALEANAALASDDIAELCRFVRQAERGICLLRQPAQKVEWPQHGRDVAHA